MNAYHMTPDGGLDRRYLRVCAVYRCLSRYGAPRSYALAKLSEVMPQREAAQLFSIWLSGPFKDRQL